MIPAMLSNFLDSIAQAPLTNIPLLGYNHPWMEATPMVP